MNGFKNINDTVANKKFFVKISEIADKIMQEEFSLLETEKMPLIDHGGSTTIMTTGVESLDSLLPSFETGNVYLICGRSSMGKKELLFQIALNIAASTQKSVYVQSLNLLENQIVRRMISQMAGIGIKTGSEEVLAVEEKDCMYSCWSMMDNLPIYISNKIVGVEVLSQFMKNEVENSILFIDYFQLIFFERKEYMDLDTERLEILRTLKQLAKEKNMTIILCSQLSRAVDYHSDKRPKLQDFRRGVEKEVDGVIFIYRDAYYSKDAGDNVELILAKNPNGKTGTAYVRFNEKTGMFEDK